MMSKHDPFAILLDMAQQQAKKTPQEPAAELLAIGHQMRQLHLAFIKAGFSRSEALELTKESLIEIIRGGVQHAMKKNEEGESG